MAFCPHCGTDIVVDAPIMINDFAMNGAGYPLLYQGKKVPLTTAEATICWALLKAYPRTVDVDALIERIGSNSEHNSVQALVCRIRRKFRNLGLPRTIDTASHGMHAYVWNPRGVKHEVLTQAQTVPAGATVVEFRSRA